MPERPVHTSMARGLTEGAPGRGATPTELKHFHSIHRLMLRSGCNYRTTTMPCYDVQRPLHHLGKDMIDLLRPGGPLPEQHATEMDTLENRGRTGVSFFTNVSTSPAEALLSLVLAGATPAPPRPNANGGTRYPLFMNVHT